MHTRAQTPSQHAHTRARTHTITHARARTHARIYFEIHANARTHTAHTFTHTHTHTYIMHAGFITEKGFSITIFTCPNNCDCKLRLLNTEQNWGNEAISPRSCQRLMRSLRALRLQSLAGTLAGWLTGRTQRAVYKPKDSLDVDMWRAVYKPKDSLDVDMRRWCCVGISPVCGDQSLLWELVNALLETFSVLTRLSPFCGLWLCVCVCVPHYHIPFRALSDIVLVTHTHTHARARARARTHARTHAHTQASSP